MTLAFLVPGALDQLTGGYLFDHHVVEGLRAMGREVNVVELAGRYPDADEVARAAAAEALGRLPDGSIAVIDGLALPAFADGLAQAAPRLRLVGFIHHPLSLETGLSATEVRHYAALEARLWPLLRGLVCSSRHTADAVTGAGIAAHRVAVATPGTTKPARIDGRKAHGTLQLLAVGTITPRKGHLLLVEALAGLRDHPWRLTCIGSLARDPAAAAALRQAITAHALDDRVVLAGEQPAALLETAYRRADLFVLPSYHEGYGMVYAEALVHGLPVIATTAGAIPDTVPAMAALLVPPGDAAALRKALQRVFTDADLRARLAAGAVSAAAALPDWPTAVERWVAALDRLAA
ncbi:MAG: glycosyltransferase family 4 protein [Burkholderiales bacterium]